MELEEAIKELESLSPSETAIETVLQALENSIPKNTVEDKMKKLRQEALEVHSALIRQTKKEYDYMLYKHYLDLIQQIKILRELLEDK